MEPNRPDNDITREEFWDTATALWRRTYPVLAVSFYCVLCFGWLLLSWKVWGVLLSTLYVLLGLANYFFVVSPSSFVAGESIFPKGFWHSVFVSPLVLLTMQLSVVAIVAMSFWKLAVAGRARDGKRKEQ